MIDIIFFLLLTVFFIFKLKSAFGTRNNEDKRIRDKTIEEFFKEKYGKNAKIKVVDAENVVDITDKLNKVSESSTKNDFKCSFDITDTVKRELINIGFNEENFLRGAENAVEMVNEAFSNKNEETLRTMLGTKLFTHFIKQIEDLTIKERTLKSSLISILKEEIKNIKIVNKNILIEVYFKMEQINFVENDKNEVIAGSKKKIEEIEENWIFKRAIKSETNFWIVDDIKNS